MASLFNRFMVSRKECSELVKLDYFFPIDNKWDSLINDLRKWGITLEPEGDDGSEVIKLPHQVVRESFKNDFKKNFYNDWVNAQSKLFSYFKTQADNNIGENGEDNIKSVKMIIRAIHHGCEAGPEVFKESYDLYRSRLSPRNKSGWITDHLGLFREDRILIGLLWNSDSTYKLQLKTIDRAWLMARNSYLTQERGDLSNAIKYRNESTKLYEESLGNVENKTECLLGIAFNLLEKSVLNLRIGRIQKALDDIDKGRTEAVKALANANNKEDKIDAFASLIRSNVYRGWILHWQGKNLSEAKNAFLAAETEERKAIKEGCGYNLPSLAKHAARYCLLLLDMAENCEDYLKVFKKANKYKEELNNEKWKKQNNLCRIAIGRAYQRLQLVNNAIEELSTVIDEVKNDYEENREVFCMSHITRAKIYWEMGKLQDAVTDCHLVENKIGSSDPKEEIMGLALIDIYLLKAHIEFDHYRHSINEEYLDKGMSQIKRAKDLQRKIENQGQESSKKFELRQAEIQLAEARSFFYKKNTEEKEQASHYFNQAINTMCRSHHWGLKHRCQAIAIEIGLGSQYWDEIKKHSN